jgi:hypothetical protein
MVSIPLALGQVISGTEMEFQLPKLCCPECNSYLADVKKAPRLPSCIFNLHCLKHHKLPSLFVCRKHSNTFTLKTNLNHYISNAGCGHDEDLSMPFLPLGDETEEDAQQNKLRQ